MSVGMHACKQLYIVGKQPNQRIHICTSMYTHVDMYMYMYTYANACVYMYTSLQGYLPATAKKLSREPNLAQLKNFS